MVMLWHLASDGSPIRTIDDTIELIWTERFGLVGEFILTIPAGNTIDFAVDDYLYFNCTEFEACKGFMIVETIYVSSAPDTGPLMTIKGRTLESILERRVVWDMVDVADTNPVDFLQSLIDSSIGDLAATNRRIPNFVFTPGEVVLEDLVSYQYWGENVLDVVLSVLNEFSLGLTCSISKTEFKMELYGGVNRSATQTERPYVMFSPEYDNLGSSDYLTSAKTLSNVGMVLGEGDGSARTQVIINDSAYAGYDRREVCFDGGSISKTVDGGELTDNEYTSRLTSYGTDELAKEEWIDTLTAEVDFFGTFRFGEDYFLGDIVQIKTEYGVYKSVQITEVVYELNSTGLVVTPTFTVKEEEENG